MGARVVTDRREANGLVECPRCGPRPGRVVGWGLDGCPLVVECLTCYRRVPVDASDTPAARSPPPPPRARPRPRPFSIEMAPPLTSVYSADVLHDDGRGRAGKGGDSCGK